ncbi:MAG: hypothetical protein ACPG49_12135 [Chitinophagales bacterium]
MEGIVDIDCYMLKENIIDFLKTGELTNFPFGISLTIVFSILGETKWTIPISRKDRRIAVAKYGQIEFYFDYGFPQKLHGIKVIYSEMGKKGIIQRFEGEKGRMKVNYQRFEGEVSYTETKKILFEHDIDFQEDRNGQIIFTEKGVVFYFDENDFLQTFQRFV